MFCKNCGAEIGESKFCPNCGASSTAPITVSNSHSAYYHQICEYSREANSFFVFGLLSLIFCMGIGLIFEVICFIKGMQMKKYQNLLAKDFTLEDYPEEWEKLKGAQAKGKSGYLMFAIGVCVTFILLFALGCVTFIRMIGG